MLTKEILEKEYHTNLLTQREIAERYECTYGEVRRLMKKWNVSIIYNRTFLARKDLEFTPEQYQMLLGTLLGDGTITVNPGSGSCKFEVQHTIKQVDYLVWKAEVLRNFIARKPPYRVIRWRISKPSKKMNFSKKEYEGVHFHTIVAPCFNKLRDLFYPNGVKRVSKEILDQLEPLGLAVWFMDDGSRTAGGLRINGVWDDVERRAILDYFGRDYPNIRLFDYRGTSGECVVQFNKVNAVKFVATILPYLYPSMYYKIRHIRTEPSETIR
jgi:recombination protein RecA